MKNLLYRLFHHDKMSNGLIVGLFVPIVLFGSLLLLFESVGLLKLDSTHDTIHLLRPRTLGLLAICANVLFMQTFNKIRWFQSMRGLAVATFICIVLWVLKYLKEIF